MLLLAVITNAQLTYFDADYYKNASKNMNSSEKEYLDQYVKKFKKLGLKSNVIFGDSIKYPDVIAHQFYNLRINLDKYEEF